MFGNARIIRRERRRLYPFCVSGEVMNVVLGLVVGFLIGWAAFVLSHMSPQRGLLTSLLLGAIGGGIGIRLASMVTGVPGIEDARYVFSPVMAAGTASAVLITASMIESR
jgi:uncharacterized membrane protein YeaQ/YmgE (transglycosylase-associated protein family)